jgi:hypothetical protein
MTLTVITLFSLFVQMNSQGLSQTGVRVCLYVGVVWINLRLKGLWRAGLNLELETLKRLGLSLDGVLDEQFQPLHARDVYVSAASAIEIRRLTRTCFRNRLNDSGVESLWLQDGIIRPDNTDMHSALMARRQRDEHSHKLNMSSPQSLPSRRIFAVMPSRVASSASNASSKPATPSTVSFRCSLWSKTVSVRVSCMLTSFSRML